MPEQDNVLTWLALKLINLNSTGNYQDKAGLTSIKEF